MKKYKVQKNGKSTVVEANSPEEAHSIANQGGFGRAFFQGLTDYTGDEAEAAVLANLPTAITGDPRSYQQNSDKLISTGFKKEFSVLDAIDDLISAFDSGKLNDKDEYHTVRWMKHLKLVSN